VVAGVTACSPAEAVERALSMVGRLEPYVLGTGDYRPGKPDLPFTDKNGRTGSDCWGFAGAWCYKLPRHRPGFNHGHWASVTDWINTDSAIEDAEHQGELYEVVDRPALGDLLVFPSIRGPDGRRLRIGHAGIITRLCAEWDPKEPQYGELEVVQCQASRKPAIIKGPGLGWLFREKFKGATSPAWWTRILRVVR
jgi:hypothetical protein